MADTDTDTNNIDLPTLDRRLALSAAEVGLLLGVSENCIKRLHEIRACRGFLVGKNLRFARRDVEAYVEQLRKRRDVE